MSALRVVRDEFGRAFSLIRRIGAGGQAEVWASEGRIAVKLMHVRTPRVGQRLRSRIDVIRRLNLDGVPVSRPLNMLAAPDVGYTMELLEEMAAIQRLATAPTGEDLLDWYAKTGGLRRRLRLLARAADAFASLHAKGIVYADPSPANIMVSDSVRHEEVRLVDVDLLHAESVPLEIGGTPGYAAPELRSGWTGVTNASDAYAFAVIAFETLTQAHPFLGDQVQFGEPEMLNVAYDAKLPWIDHSEDDSNRTRYGLARDRVLSPKLRSLAKQTFQDSLTSLRSRPTVAEWRTALHSAADMTLDCAGCPQSNDARLGACPWCGTPAPDPLVAVVQLALPDRAEPVPAKEGLAVPPASWLPINPRTAYLDAAEYDTAPVAWLWWEDGRVLAVNNAGQIPLWLRPDRDPRQRRRRGTNRPAQLAGGRIDSTLDHPFWTSRGSPPAAALLSGAERGDRQMRKRKLDPLPGAETFVWLTWQGDDWPKEEAEIVLWWSARGDIFARHQAGQAPVEPGSSQDRAKLERFRLGTEPHVTIVVEARRHPQRRPWGELGVTISRFDTGGSLPPQQIAFDDKPCQTIARWERSKVYETQPERTRDWLARHFLLPDLQGVDEVAERVVVSTVFDEVGSSGYTIHGRGYVADVRMIDDRLRLQRLRRPTERDRKRRLRLVRAKVEFEDVSRVGELRADMRQWIDRLVEGEGFLAMWRDYNRLETRYVRRLVRETGSCHYQGWQRIAGGGYRFTVESPVPSPADDKSSLLRQAHRAVERNVKLELEAAAKLPAFLLEYGDDDSDADDWSLIENRLERHVFSGTVTGVEVAKGTIDIESIQLHGRGPSGVGGDRDTDLPKSGVLFRSFRGDRSQLARRREAFDRIRTGGTNIPNLLALLEGERVDAKPPELILIRSDAAWAIFKGKPTKSQQDAIDVALNTPDIAIIKGPPGTGKTEVIAAIQTRLAESGKSFAQLRGSILLTSFQHAAVDEMAGRSVIFGIPADKVDRADRGSAVLRDRLRDDISTGVQARMAEPAAAVLALRKLSGRVAGYWLSPHSVKSTVTLLTDMLRDAGPYLSAALVDRLRTARDELTIGEQAPVPAERTEARELALRALRGLRTEPAAFADDGPRTAAKALRRLRALAESEEAFARHDLDLLVRAAEWAAEPPDFLPELTGLRDQLMDPLITIDGPAPVLTADPAVADLLNEAIEEMDDALRRSPDTGPALALVDYLEAFYGDPQAVEWTLRSYTASYATTCQQAVSKKIATAKSVKDSEDVVFDTVIVDEAARANPLDLMIPMTLAARRIVLVGDHHQLPPMLEPDVEQQFVDEDEEKRAALRQSLFERLFKAHGQAGAPVERVVTLNEQFRMHKVLGDFVSRNFYDGQLGSPRGSTGFAHELKYGDAVAVWLDVPNDQGEEYRKRSTHRPIEANRLVQELEPLIRSAPDLTFGVISFYTDQVESIGDALVARGIAKRVDGGRYEAREQFRQDSKGKPLNRLLVGSVDAFQGKQFDVVLLSTTRSAPASDNVRPRLGSRDYLKWERRRYGHVLLKNRLCVAMSRQRRLLLVVGDAAMFEPDRAPTGAAPITDFLRLCRTGGDHGDFIPA